MISSDPLFPYTSLADKADAAPRLTSFDVLPTCIVSCRGASFGQANSQGWTALALSAGDSPAHCVIDFGQEVVGTLAISASANRSGEFSVHYGESLEEGLDCETDCGTHWYHRAVDTHSVDATLADHLHRGRRAFRYVHILVKQPGLSLTIHSIKAVCRHYPVKISGHFSCSDSLLNRIWNLCENTTKLCMQEFYEDGLKRDGLLWVSDYRAQFLCNWTPFADSVLARRSLIMMAASQMENGAIPSCAGAGGGHQHPEGIGYMPGIPHGSVDRWILIHYASDYLSCLKDYLYYTGDTSIINLLWPTVQRLVKFLQGYDYDLKPELNDRMTESDGWKSQGTTLLQVLTGVVDGITLAKFNKDAELEADLINLKDYLSARVKTEHYDAKSGWYTDDLVASSNASPSAHVNGFAVISGLVGERDAGALLSRVAKTNARQASWGGMRMWQHVSEFQAGLPEKALQGMRKYWGFMLDRDATTAWETNDMQPGGNWSEFLTSRCHGWSAGACHLLPAWLLGVRPASVGFKSATFRPQLGDLEWAEGCIPTPCGEIRVELESSGKGWISAPDSVQMHPQIPAGRPVPDIEYRR